MSEAQRAESNGGPMGIRTPDLFHAMEALYQLSYWPILFIKKWLEYIKPLLKNQDVSSFYLLAAPPSSVKQFPKISDGPQYIR